MKKILLLSLVSILICLCCGFAKDKISGEGNLGKVTKNPEAHLVYFSYNHIGMAREPYQIIIKKGNKYQLKRIYKNPFDHMGKYKDDMFEYYNKALTEAFEEEEEKAIILTKTDIKKLENALDIYNVLSWNGYNKTKKDPPFVLDSGDAYDLKIGLSDGSIVDMHSYNCYPQNFSEFIRFIAPIINKGED